MTENGVSEKVQCTQLCDEWRIEYLKGYINEILKGNFKNIFSVHELFERFHLLIMFYSCKLHHREIFTDQDGQQTRRLNFNKNDNLAKCTDANKYNNLHES